MSDFAFCPSKLMRRSAFDSTKETLRSFKSWDTCMDNRVCKIVAIVGIVLASIVAIWIVGSLLRCFMRGVSGICDFLCWPCCCYRRHRQRRREEKQRAQVYAPPPQVVYQPVVTPEAARYYGKDEYYSERKKGFSSSSNESYDLEAQKAGGSRGRYGKRGAVHDEDVNQYEERLWGTQRKTPPAQRQAPYPVDSSASPYGHYNRI
ncbi:ADL259Wp [Eremothecium gossypii ATCC 10895]|uniref:ADL259Wp n=1 Tax=Eremothecium gossypii (strain ATCC 10895 / CBS 109.51 / FGSC 9923 / NRRL Y-1056) TaxID=284811 RepID=Q75B36_EREGS|nr:ADL259Wp [Eremothecium gossypii ATCC 10895]AAS51661.1 ADL259Wp [Eremothecium gossypii ATCC 10895]AEY95958.1 FADL259Wp [Eremothecium gossypii FDAG1]